MHRAAGLRSALSVPKQEEASAGYVALERVGQVERWEAVWERSAAGLPGAFWADPVLGAEHRWDVARRGQTRVEPEQGASMAELPEDERGHRETADASVPPGADRAPGHWGAGAAHVPVRRGEPAVQELPAFGGAAQVPGWAVPGRDEGLRALLAQGSREVLPVEPLDRPVGDEGRRRRRLQGAPDAGAAREHPLHPALQVSGGHEAADR